MRILKIFILLNACLLVFHHQLKAQDVPTSKHHPKDHILSPELDDSDEDRHGNLNAFYLRPYIGDLSLAPLDTIQKNFMQRAIVEGRSIGSAYAGGTYASPYFSKFFFSEQKNSRMPLFYFGNPYHFLLKQGELQRWFDTKVPLTSVSYVKGGGSDALENNFHFLFSTNIGKRFNFGGSFDYDYANGVYAQTKSKNLSYRVFSSYTGNKYKFYFSLGNTNVVNFESGGITDDKYITRPEDFETGKKSFLPKDIPTRFQNTWNRNIFGSARLHQKYSLGFYRDTENPNDSTAKEFVPVTTIFNDISVHKHRRRFVSEFPNITKEYGDISYIDPPKKENDKEISRFYPDETHLSNSLNVTAGLTLEEGFHKWAKMGIAAYLRWEVQEYSLPKLKNEEAATELKENTSYVGARLSTTKGKRFNYYVTGELAVIGQYIGNIHINGEAKLNLPIKNKMHEVRLFGSFHNQRAPYTLKHFHSTFFSWDKDFNAVQHLNLGGELNLPISNTKLRATIETIQNPVYINTKGVPEQLNDNFRAMSFILQQKLHFGVLHWDNKLEYQHLSNKDIFRYPELLANSNLYLQTKLAKVMLLQLGLDAYWHSSYKAPYYEPATQLLIPQDEITIGGNTALINGYANAHLKRARFFVMYYNLGSLILPPNYFSLPHYPTYPPMIRVGIIVDFRN